MEKKPSTNKTQGVLQTTLITFRILSRYTNIFEEHSEPEVRAPNPADQTTKKSGDAGPSPRTSVNVCSCSHSGLTPSSSSSELSKMLSKSWREGAKSVTCVRLLEPALPAALSCRTSVGKEAKGTEWATSSREKEWGEDNEQALPANCFPTFSVKFRDNYCQIRLSVLKGTEKQTEKYIKDEIKLLLLQ